MSRDPLQVRRVIRDSLFSASCFNEYEKMMYDAAADGRSRRTGSNFAKIIENVQKKTWDLIWKQHAIYRDQIAAAVKEKEGELPELKTKTGVLFFCGYWLLVLSP